jgi:spermidine synthase
MSDRIARSAVDNTITLSEQGGVRYLHFGTEWVQGAMRLSRPYAIEIDYVRDMMAWLLFLESPQAILQLGLGAAALTKFCHRFCAPSRVQVVEIDPQVREMARRWFALPPDDERLGITIADAHAFLRTPGQAATYGVIQVDLYDREARGPVLDSVAFYRACRAALGPAGVMTVNLFGEDESFQRSRQNLRRAFDGRVVYLPALAEGNVVALACSGPPLEIRAADLLRRADWLKSQLGLPARSWAQALLGAAPSFRL